MKQLWKVMLLLTLVVCFVFCLAACGEDEGTTQNTPSDQEQETPGGKTDKPEEKELLPIPLSTVKFCGTKNSQAFTYKEGTYYTLEESKYLKLGNTELERFTVKYEYWDKNNETKVANQGVGVTEPGTYTVRAYFSKEGYKTAYVTAKLIIDTSYTISYDVSKSLPAAVAALATVDEGNPTEYSLAGKTELLSGASAPDYKFKAWYTSETFEEDTLITSFDPTKFKGNVTLYGKFQPYLPYPTAYSPTHAEVTVAPETLPAIPGYDSISEDSLTIIDMANMHKESDKRYGFKYDSSKIEDPDTGEKKEYFYSAVAPDATPTANGAYALEWFDFNDDHDFEDGNGVNDGWHSTSMYFGSPDKDYPVGTYNTVEFWMYSANATGRTITVFILTGENSKSMTFDITFDFTGWKKFSINFCDTNAPAGYNERVTEIRFLGSPIPGLRADAANLCVHTDAKGKAIEKQTNFIYLSNVYVTNRDNNYSVRTTIGESALESAMGLFQDLTFCSAISDSAVADLLTKLNTFSQSTASVFSDIALTSSANIKTTYDRLADLAKAWNCKTSTYYRQDDLLAKIGGAMNWLSAQAISYVNNGAALDDNIRAVCFDIADITTILGDHISTRHAKEWCYPINYYFPAPELDGIDAFNSAYLSAVASIACGNVREAVTALRTLSHVLLNNEITLADSGADISRYTAFIATFFGSNMVPTKGDYLADVFTWFDQSVDALLVDGKVPTGINGDFASYLRAMLFVYNCTNLAQKNLFASKVKYYLAQNEGLEQQLKDAMLYDIEQVALDAIKENETPAASGEDFKNAIVLIEDTASALYKTATAYLFITPNGIVSSGIDATAIDTTYTTLSGMIVGDSLILVTDKQIIFVSNNTVTVTEDANATYNFGTNEAVYVLRSNATLAATSIISSANAPLIIYSKVEEDVTEFTVYNYAKTVEEVSIYLNGNYETDMNYNDVSTELDTALELTKITLAIDADKKDITFTFGMIEQD